MISKVFWNFHTEVTLINHTHPFWFIGVYLVGMILIGYPLAFWSLRAYRHQMLYPRAANLLFPFSRYMQIHDESYFDGHIHLSSSELGWVRHEKINEQDRIEYAKYTIITMFFWPLRVIFMTFGLVLVGLRIATKAAFENSARALASCGKCLRVD